MKSKKWLLGWTIIVIVTLSMVGVIVFKIDPFFHYHKPLTEDYFYKLNNQRSQNDGIAKHFDYDAIIVGTSLTENFKTSELDELFGTKSIKIPTSGGSFKEVNDLAKTALENNKDIKIVIRGLDKWMFEDEADRMREDLGEYPEYLYDENPLNDVYYLFNKDVLFNRIGTMLNESMDNGVTGITSFDEYSRWQEQCTFGRNSVIPNGTDNVELGNVSSLSEEVKKNVIENTIQNITSIADEYKDVQFYYFFSPYSIHWYKVQKELGWIYTHIEAERIIIEEILKHDNIKLFIFNDDPEIISDLNNYKDDEHYASWINSYILKCMKNGEHLVTKTNYGYYLDQEFEYCKHFDFSVLNNQEDYENDDYQGALWNQKIWNVEPISLLKNNDGLELNNIEVIEKGLKVTSNESEIKININSVGHYNYLVFYHKDLLKDSKVIINSKGKTIEKELITSDINDTYKQEVIDISDIKDGAIITFTLKSNEDLIVLSDIVLY